MFFNNKDKTYLNHWYNWAADGAEKEQLFQDIRQLVEDMIRELVPPMIKEFIQDEKEVINYDIQTTLNGKANNLGNLREDLESFVFDEIRKKIR